MKVLTIAVLFVMNISFAAAADLEIDPENLK